jgi:putative membrane protein
MRAHLWTLSAALVISAGAMPLLADTSEFLTKAMKGDNSETALGALAAKRGQSANVRKFGAMLEQDHGKGKAQAAAVAARHKVPRTDALADEAMTESAVLQRLHGAAFDHEFGRYMVEDHTKDIADFEKEVRSKDPADVRALARNTLPILRKHLVAAKSIG